jgi:hypothetical protein
MDSAYHNVGKGNAALVILEDLVEDFFKKSAQNSGILMLRKSGKLLDKSIKFAEEALDTLKRTRRETADAEETASVPIFRHMFAKMLNSQSFASKPPWTLSDDDTKKPMYWLRNFVREIDMEMQQSKLATDKPFYFVLPHYKIMPWAIAPLLEQVWPNFYVRAGFTENTEGIVNVSASANEMYVEAFSGECDFVCICGDADDIDETVANLSYGRFDFDTNAFGSDSASFLLGTAGEEKKGDSSLKKWTGAIDCIVFVFVPKETDAPKRKRIKLETV